MSYKRKEVRHDEAERQLAREVIHGAGCVALLISAILSIYLFGG